MKKTRRIEITAFRRTTRVSVDEVNAGSSNQPAPQVDVTQSTDEASVRIVETDSAGAILSSVDDVASHELAHLIGALVESNRDSAPAAQEVGLSRSRPYSMLRSLGVQIKRLKTSFGKLSKSLFGGK